MDLPSTDAGASVNNNASTNPAWKSLLASSPWSKILLKITPVIVAFTLGMLYEQHFMYDVSETAAYRRLADTAAKIVRHRHPCGEPPCTLKFIKYEPSPWESAWSENADKWDKTAEMCKHMTREQVDTYLAGTRQAQASGCGHLLSTLGDGFNKEVFSTYHWEDTCSKEAVVSYIEPLVGLMRAPQVPCFDTSWNAIIDRDYLMYGRSSEACKTSTHPEQASNMRYKKFFFFDLGASTYTNGPGGASQKTFVDGYAHLGVLPIDMHYFAWEANPVPPPEAWAEIPGTIKLNYHWLNIPANMDPDHPDNPWTYVRNLCTAGDFVAVKLDIDNTPVETAFMEQLIADTELQGLIDEMFFEHHVNVQHMIPYWQTQSETVYLKDSYTWFVKLRQAGIRFHGWP